MVDAPKHAAVAVVRFADGTGNFTKSGSAGRRQVNLAKSGDFGTPIGALPPELQAEYFAQELASTGLFENVRVAVDADDLQNEKLVIDGTVSESFLDIGDSWNFRFAMKLTAKRDGQPVWEREAGADHGYFPHRAGFVSIGGRKEPTNLPLSGVSGPSNGAMLLLQRFYRSLIEDLDAALTSAR